MRCTVSLNMQRGLTAGHWRPGAGARSGKEDPGHRRRAVCSRHRLCCAADSAPGRHLGCAAALPAALRQLALGNLQSCTPCRHREVRACSRYQHRSLLLCCSEPASAPDFAAAVPISLGRLSHWHSLVTCAWKAKAHAYISSECAYQSSCAGEDAWIEKSHMVCRAMLENEAKDGHRGVFELLHLSEKGSGASVVALSPREFPLYYGGKELKPFQYGLFLLSKVSREVPCTGWHAAGRVEQHAMLLAAAMGVRRSRMQGWLAVRRTWSSCCMRMACTPWAQRSSCRICTSSWLQLPLLCHPAAAVCRQAQSEGRLDGPAYRSDCSSCGRAHDVPVAILAHGPPAIGQLSSIDSFPAQRCLEKVMACT